MRDDEGMNEVNDFRGSCRCGILLVLVPTRDREPSLRGREGWGGAEKGLKIG